MKCSRLASVAKPESRVPHPNADAHSNAAFFAALEWKSCYSASSCRAITSR